jgi:hypothetical protein
MQYPFDTIWKLLKSLPKPDRGSQDSWRTWYETSWSHLSHSKLIDVNTHLDITRAKLVALTLCWIVNDFVGATYEYCEDYELYWNDWRRDMEISPLFAFVIATEAKSCSPSLSEAEIYQEAGTCTCEEDLTVDSSEFESDLSARICSMVALELRTKIVDLLAEGFGDSSLLFASLYMASQSLDPVDKFRQLDLEELEEVESELADEEESIRERERLEARRGELLGMEYQDDLKQEQEFEELDEIEDALEEMQSSIPNKEKLEKRREELLRSINRENIKQLAYDAAVDDILNGSLSFGDEEFNQRLNGIDWCRNGCSVVNSGSPSVYHDE